MTRTDNPRHKAAPRIEGRGLSLLKLDWAAREKPRQKPLCPAAPRLPCEREAPAQPAEGFHRRPPNAQDVRAGPPFALRGRQGSSASNKPSPPPLPLASLVKGRCRRSRRRDSHARSGHFLLSGFSIVPWTAPGVFFECAGKVAWRGKAEVGADGGQGFVRIAQ